MGFPHVRRPNEFLTATLITTHTSTTHNEKFCKDGLLQSIMYLITNLLVEPVKVYLLKSTHRACQITYCTKVQENTHTWNKDW